MGMKWGRLLPIMLSVCWTLCAPQPAFAVDDEASRALRWEALRHALFGDRPIEDGAAWIDIDAPERALDAALVPVALEFKGDRPIKGIYLVIDDNPAPLAGHFTFGPQGDPHSLKLRVRVNAYTYMHAVAETRDGKLYSAARFVKAAGGCSAPAGSDQQQALKDIGHIKLRLMQPFIAGKPLQAQLMIRHPNFNGMQMDQLTRLYTPAMFIRTIDLSYDGAEIMHLDSDISLSSDPVIGFGFIAPRKGRLEVQVRDDKATFAQSFDIPAPAEEPATANEPAATEEPAGYWTGAADSPVPATLRGGTVVRVADLEALLKTGKAVVVDVSNAPRKPDGLAPAAPWMPLPHPALPDAIWIPGAGLGILPASLDEFYRSRLRTATAGNIDTPLVVYCHERCWLSWNAAKRAIGYGYRRVYWFTDGIEGWTAAGQPTTATLAQAPSALPKLVVFDIELTGDLGGPPFAEEHAARLNAESARLRQALTRTGLYEILDTAAAADTLDRLKSQQAYLYDCNGCDLDVGRQLQADYVLLPWVNRVSGLILTLTYEIHEVRTSRITARKSFDFRGDNDIAWNHAIDYMVRDLKASSTAATRGGAGARSFSHFATNVEATALPTTLVALRPMSSK